MALGALEVVTMLSVVWRVAEGRTARPREGKSWVTIGLEAWGLDILAQRSFLWLVGSRWFVLMGANMLVNFAVFYLAQTFALGQAETGLPNIALLGATVAGNVLTVIPAGRISDRVGRKPVIYTACAVAGAGMAIIAAASAIPVAVVGALLFGSGMGMFLAVDWALMTDIIPRASSGRYMGISNVATATAGIVAVMTGACCSMLSTGPPATGPARASLSRWPSSTSRSARSSFAPWSSRGGRRTRHRGRPNLRPEAPVATRMARRMLLRH